MGKHLDKLGEYEDFTAPWETSSGTDAEIDKTKLKRLMWNARQSEAKALDEVDDMKTELETAEKDLEAAKTELSKANGDEAQKKIDRLQKKVDDLTAEIRDRDAAAELAALREEVLADVDPDYREWISGEDRESLEKALEKFTEKFPEHVKGAGDDEDDDDDEIEPTVRTRPRVQNPGDPKPSAGGDAPVDFDAAAAKIVAGGRLFG